MQATIEGESGYFYGSVSKQTGQPAGAGVLKTDDGWIHCGDFKNGTFADGNQVSVNKKEYVLRLTRQKSL